MLVFWRAGGSLSHMIRHPVLALLMLACTSAALSGQAYLALSHRAPEIDIHPGSSRRGSLRLPALEFHFSVDARCPEMQAAKSLMISIADSRKRVMESALQSALKSGLSVTVPSQQIAPISVGDFCADDKTETRAYITMGDLLSAQGALSCGTGSETSITYVSTSLDVRLHCARQQDIDSGAINLP